jgi:hypothetical protein
LTEPQEPNLSNEEAFLLAKSLDEAVNWDGDRYRPQLDDAQLMQLVHEIAADRGTRAKIDRMAALAIETTAKRNLLTALTAHGFRLVHEA